MAGSLRRLRRLCGLMRTRPSGGYRGQRNLIHPVRRIPNRSFCGEAKELQDRGWELNVSVDNKVERENADAGGSSSMESNDHDEIGWLRAVLASERPTNSSMDENRLMDADRLMDAAEGKEGLLTAVEVARRMQLPLDEKVELARSLGGGVESALCQSGIGSNYGAAYEVLREAMLSLISEKADSITPETVVYVVERYREWRRLDLSVAWLLDFKDNVGPESGESLRKSVKELLKELVKRRQTRAVETLVSSFDLVEIFKDQHGGIQWEESLIMLEVCLLLLDNNRPSLVRKIVDVFLTLYSNNSPKLAGHERVKVGKQWTSVLICSLALGGEKEDCLKAFDLSIELWESNKRMMRQVFMCGTLTRILATQLKETNSQLAAYFKLVALKASGKTVPPSLLAAVILSMTHDHDAAWSIYEESRRLASHRIIDSAICRVLAVHGDWRRLQKLRFYYEAQPRKWAENMYDYLFRGYMFAGRLDLAFDLLLSEGARNGVGVHTLKYALEYAISTVKDDELINTLAGFLAMKDSDHENTLKTLGKDSADMFEVEVGQNLNIFAADLKCIETYPWLLVKLQELEETPRTDPGFGLYGRLV
mmetsp:Transcript_24655/g.43828  ORF Transcript_24655/g.43828 Transcript_24655/m.43828 type:complete len:594 (-) Transcript_24655:34-1815(-)